MTEKKYEIIEDFISNYEHVVKELENYIDYLILPESINDLKHEVFKILKKKMKKMKKAESVDELKKVLKVKKIIKR